MHYTSGLLPVYKDRVKRIIFKHAIYAGVFCLIIFFYKCPVYYFFNFPCPGCGLTRAYIALFNGDIKSAFYNHPLFLTVMPTVLYGAHKNYMKIKLNPIIEETCFICLFAAFLAAYFIRIFIYDWRG